MVVHSSERLVGAVVVMGVCGCGKSTIGRGIAARLGCSFLEGDELHPPANVAKMSRGIPLQDGDRWPWLDAIGAALGSAAHASGSAVAACSALKRVYRDRLSAAAGVPIRYVHLAGTRELLSARMSARKDHFMPTSLLDSQLATLEPLQPDETAVVIDVAWPPERQIEAGVEWLERARQAGG